MTLDRYTCYEACAQNPRRAVAMIRSLHPEALILREDFCGTAAIACRWAAEGRMRGDEATAVGVDLDQDALARGTEAIAAERVGGLVTLIHTDAVLGPSGPAESADIVFVGNFSIGFIKTRADLLNYCRASRHRLRPGGVLICEVYGGEGSWRPSVTERRHFGPAVEDIHYRWECERADPITRMVTHAMSFRVVKNGVILADLPRAFVCEWRLWSGEELRAAMLEAGFRSVGLFPIPADWPEPNPVPANDLNDLGEDWVGMIAARV